jgi:hypothetical protein
MTAAAMVAPVAVAVAVLALPVPDLLVVPLILGAGWVSGRVLDRRLRR